MEQKRKGMPRHIQPIITRVQEQRCVASGSLINLYTTGSLGEDHSHANCQQYLFRYASYVAPGFYPALIIIPQENLCSLHQTCNSSN
uniref:Uncharacterized protein n=1 Tax=Pyxicephalus adspersus TaxID=30357 RepID=A0AAV2ZQD2_PYXAD|nr:TPA: hypothetical protein GDO54_004018 [Pyxicephalus adspersus]